MTLPFGGHCRDLTILIRGSFCSKLEASYMFVKNNFFLVLEFIASFGLSPMFDFFSIGF